MDCFSYRTRHLLGANLKTSSSLAVKPGASVHNTSLFTIREHILNVNASRGVLLREAQMSQINFCSQLQRCTCLDIRSLADSTCLQAAIEEPLICLASLTEEPGIHNHRFGKKLSFCHFTSCSHHEFIRVLQFLPICYQRLTLMCLEFCPQVGHTFVG